MVCSLLFVGWCPLSGVGCQLSVLWCQEYVVQCSLYVSVVHYLMFVDCCLFCDVLFVIGGC